MTQPPADPPAPQSPETAVSAVPAPAADTDPLLNPRRERFCRYYLTEPSATRAAVKAGYSPNGARQAGHRLLTNVASVTLTKQPRNADKPGRQADVPEITPEMIEAGRNVLITYDEGYEPPEALVRRLFVAMYERMTSKPARSILPTAT